MFLYVSGGVCAAGDGAQDDPSDSAADQWLPAGLSHFHPPLAHPAL